MHLDLRGPARRFYDGGLPATATEPAEPPDRDAEPRIVLERTLVGGRESFAMRRRIAYDDRCLGELLVPARTGPFRTDLTSVPWLFTWLVPRTGAHLPAALLHDGLVRADGGPSYVSTEGHVVDRVEADRVFRDAMGDTGTRLVRRWLMWTGVTTWTMLGGRGTGWSATTRWRHRLAALLTIVAVAWLGASATLDLLDVGGVAPLVGQVPWMPEGPWWTELLAGLAGAVVVPFALGLAWGRFRIAGWVLGTGTALLLPVTVVLLLLTGLYQAVEWLLEPVGADRSGPSPTLGT